ncbi:MAG: insulinase family protein [Chloroflexi bacterium]|uniref:Insulinase family protein n=2 Tax=Candidatus Chlorohelix allophototropha TaxID=3003348 RepID=A0A8T7MA78_9CHLR|nr:insulinase family protein [Chloroflexota bacterium]WJW68963.1 insulinase family protein [Chloroflexota bacterium L227-S17]
MPDVHSLTIGILLEVGSRHEKAEENGIAHCIEHLLFRGTSTRDAATLARMIDLAGGQLGAFTTRDYTCLFAAVLDDYRTFALDIFGDLLLHSVFEDESIKREQEVIIQELEAGDERPEKLAQQLLKNIAWNNHPLGSNIYGNRDSVACLNRNNIIDFYLDYYGADRIIVAAAGNLEHEDFVAQTNDALWALPTSRVLHAENRGNIVDFQAGLEVKKRDSAHIYFALGAPAPHYTSENRYSAYVLNSLLGAGMSSRLYRQIRDERALVYDIGSSYHPYCEAGMLLVEGFTTPPNFIPVLYHIVETLQSLCTESVSEEEIWRAKERLRGEILLGAESSNSRMSQLSTQELYFGRHIQLDELVTEIRAVSTESITAMASDIFQPGNIALAAVGAIDELEQDYVLSLLGL